MSKVAGARGAALIVLAVAAWTMRAQVIEFESNGLKYQTLAKNGVTLMFAPMAFHLKTYTIIQVAVSNGSQGSYVIHPEDFVFMRSDGTQLRAAPAATVVQVLTEKGSRSDVLKLVNAYEEALYGIPNMRSTNGYESRRQAALMMGPSKFRAAAAASAVALSATKLPPGDSSDGAVFFPTGGKPLGPGRLVVRTNTDTFEFNPQP
ncbi:MAG TPA: hypothetical protein VMU19_06885 [Bryobacteraceae bacterium]|nr:hypothetical protein [Bryobacteraceae bacterium]